MNELQIFKSDSGEEIKIVESDDGRKKRFYINNKEVDRFELLGCALFTDSHSEAIEIMSLASFIFGGIGDSTFDSLYNSTYMEIIRKHSENEFSYHELFKKHISKLINGAEIVNDIKSINRNFPDAWVRISEINIPVEIKKSKFNVSALKQLNRYMDTYGSLFGIAVAKSLTVKLPGNIRFIGIDDIKALESREEDITLGVSELIKDFRKTLTRKESTTSERL